MDKSRKIMQEWVEKIGRFLLAPWGWIVRFTSENICRWGKHLELSRLKKRHSEESKKREGVISDLGEQLQSAVHRLAVLEGEIEARDLTIRKLQDDQVILNHQVEYMQLKYEEILNVAAMQSALSGSEIHGGRNSPRENGSHQSENASGSVSDHHQLL